MINTHNTGELSRIHANAVIAGIIVLLVSVGIPVIAGISRAKVRTIIDMAGRRVSVPDNPRRVVTVVGAPIINTFIFALGKGETIINGPNVSARVNQKDCCRFQGIFAPQFNKQPSIEGIGGTVSVETLLSLKPDLVLAGSTKSVDYIEKMGIPVVHIKVGETAESNKEIMLLLGRVYGRQLEAEGYIRYANSVIDRVTAGTSGISEKKKVRVLYCNFKTMTQSSPVADWWIEAAGGISLGKGSPVKDGARSLSPEHVLLWDPDVWVVSTPREIDMIYRDSRFKGVRAVTNRKVVSVPTGALRWSHPTSEQPLGLLWMAKILYPARFRTVNMEEEIRSFYHTFFQYRVTDRQIKEVLTGIR